MSHRPVHRGRTRALTFVSVILATSAIVMPGPSASADSNEATGAPRAARAVSAGRVNTCVVSDDGAVTCWGLNDAGQLGQGTTNSIGDDVGEIASLPPIDLGTGRSATAVAVGAQHVCALLDGGDIKCWGSGTYGRIGIGSPASRGNDPGEMGDALPIVDLGTGRTATAVTAGNFHTCAVLDNGAIKCWGNNTGGRLGLGDTQHRGLFPGEMGDALPTVDLGTGRTATAVSAGETFTCALLDGGDVTCWGANTQGQLGFGDQIGRGDGPGEMGDALPTVDLGTGRTATAITVGDFHACALLDDGSAKCWGWGINGRLGNGDIVSIGDGPGEMGDDLPAVDVGTGRTVTAIAAGDSHTCVVLDDGTGRCWGGSDLGQVGQGGTDDIGAASGQMGDALLPIDLGTGRTPVHITAGEDHTCAVLDNATVTCWGDGTDGRVGNGGTAAIGDGPGEMGDALTTVPLNGTVGAAAMTATLTRTPGSVVAGESIIHTVTITNTGHQVLVGVDVSLASSTCTPVAPIAISAIATSTCVVPTTAASLPSITRSATVTTSNVVLAASLSTTTNTITTAVTAPVSPPPPVRRPDALVRAGTKPFVGDNTYNRTGKKQTVKATTAKKPVRYTVRVQNDGNVTDTLRIRGARGTKAFTATYRVGKKNITKKVTQGTYRVRNLAPGASRDITVTVTPKKAAKPGAKTSAKVTVTSTSDTTQTDTVTVITRRR